jgi:cellobiose-specific phosphotransferase system component IIC
MSGNWAAGFFRSQLSDKDGTVSNTKVCVLMVVVAVLAWVSCLISKLHSPVTVTDIVTFVGASGTFTALICGTLAGLKYGADAINNRAANATPQVQPPDKPV